MRVVHKVRDDDEIFVPSYLRNQPKPAPHEYTPHVYFVQDGDAIKIGTAVNPPSRFKSLQVGNPRELKMLGYYRCPQTDEGKLHKQFLSHWIRGEWFRDNPELRALIALRCPANDNQIARAKRVVVYPSCFARY